MAIQSLSECLERVEHLGLFPAAAVRILELARADEATVDELESVVSTDGALTARVLKVVNSPLFGLRVRVGSLRRALQMIGFAGTRDIAISLALSGVAQKQAPWGVALWQHAEATAWACRVLSRQSRRLDPDAMFVGGLLHDLGLQLMLLLDRESILPLLQEFGPHGTRLTRAETMALGFHHGQLGAACLARWNLPETSVDLVLRHHDPVESGPGGAVDPRASSVLALADAIADPLLEGASVDDLWVLITNHPAVHHTRIARGALLVAVEHLAMHREQVTT